MVFCLVLHSSHHEHPKPTVVVIVSGGDNLVFEKVFIYFFLVSFFVGVISNENISQIEAS